MSKADNREELEAGLTEAACHDRKILVEEMIVGREVECAVFGGGRRREVKVPAWVKSWLRQIFMILTQSITTQNQRQ